MNTNLPKKSRQRNKKENVKHFQTEWISNPRILEWLKNPRHFFLHGKNHSLAHFINVLLGYGDVYDTVFPAQYTISKKIDKSLRQTNRIAQRACELGLIKKIRRKTKNPEKELTCVYQAHPVFQDVNFRKKLSDIMSSLWYLPLGLLMAIYSTDARSQTQCVLHKQIRDMKYISNYTTESSENTKTRKEYIARRLFYQDNLGEYMKANPSLLDHFLSPSVKALREILSLTPSGCIWLSSYPDAVLDAALTALKSSKVAIHKPYPWVIAFCNNLCAEQGVEVTFSYSHQIAKQTGIDIKFAPSVYAEGKRMRDAAPTKEVGSDTSSALSAAGFDTMKKLINNGAMENAFHEAQQKRYPQQTGYASSSYYAQRSPRNVSYKPQRDATVDNLKAARAWMDNETPEQQAERLKVKQGCIDQLMKTLTTMSVAPSADISQEERKARIKKRLGL